MMLAGNRIQQEATQWVVRFQLGPLAPEENAQLHTWLKADPRHRGAYVRANAVHVTVNRISALAGGVAPRGRSSFSWSAAIAAGLAAVALVAALGWFVYQTDGERYISEIGELRKVALEDGSSIFLNTSTKAVVRFGAAVREVNLPAGEALFEVAKDPSRPFLVHAGKVTVRAVGTAFSVRHDADRIEVTVTEGVVDLIHNDGTPMQRMSADRRVVIENAQPVNFQTLNRRETERQLAWRMGRLEFDGQTLSEAVAQVNRYSRRQIVVNDRELAARPVVGVFRSVDIEAFAHIAAAALDAEVSVDGAIIRIESKAAR